MKTNGLLAQILRALVKDERKKAGGAPSGDILFRQKKQLWYGMMNQVDDVEEDPPTAAASDGGTEADSSRSAF